MKYCPKCNAPCPDEATVCFNCKTAFMQQAPNYAYPPQPQPIIVNTVFQQPISTKNRWVALILCIFLGLLGIHRFYVGKVGTGLLWLFTGGMFGIGALIDLIMIACGSFTDYAGLPLQN